MSASRLRSPLAMLTLAAVLLIASVLTVQAGSRKAIVIIPDNAKGVDVAVGGKTKTYYLLRSSAPLDVDVEGPGKLTVTSRLLVSGAASEAYSLTLREGSTVLKTHETSSARSDAVVGMPGVAAAKSRKFTVRIEEGTHRLRLTSGSSAHDALVRITMQPSKGAARRTTLQPLSYDRVVTCEVDEKLIAYYVATAGRDVQFRVVGPTTVSVATRLTYDRTMKGEQKYAVVVTEGGKSILQKALTTTKSVGVEYKEWKEVVPGKVVPFVIVVPAGEHTYHLGPGPSLAHSIAFKFSIPTKDLGNEN